MKKYYKYLAVLTAVVMFNCEADDESKLSNYVGFELSPTNLVLEQNTSGSVDVKVYASEVSSSDRTFALEVDPASTLATTYSVPATVTIPANTNEGVISVTVTDDENLSFDEAVPQVLTIDFTPTAGVANGDSFSINVTEACPSIYVTLSITTDDWPEETSWELYNLDSGQVLLYSGGPYVNPDDDFTTISNEWCLLPGTYGVVVFDSYGDGGSTYTVTSGSTVFVEPTTLTSANSSSVFTIE